MGQQTFVVNISGTDMYLIGYNVGNPPESTFGNLDNAIEYTTLQEAQDVAASIGGGGAGIPKPH